MRRLIYSGGSPYARKVRIVLAELGLDYQAEAIASFPPGAEVAQHNPTLTVPVLVDGETELFESNLIIEYLLETTPRGPAGNENPPLATGMTRPDHRWADAKLLATLETLADSLVALAYMTWCGLEPVGDNLVGFNLGERHEQRVHSCLDWLEARATPEGFIPGSFSVQDIALICPLLWTDARLAFAWRGRPRLEAIVARHGERPSVQATAVTPWPFTS